MEVQNKAGRSLHDITGGSISSPRNKLSKLQLESQLNSDPNFVNLLNFKNDEMTLNENIHGTGKKGINPLYCNRNIIRTLHKYTSCKKFEQKYLNSQRSGKLPHEVEITKWFLDPFIRKLPKIDGPVESPLESQKSSPLLKLKSFSSPKPPMKSPRLIDKKFSEIYENPAPSSSLIVTQIPTLINRPQEHPKGNWSYFDNSSQVLPLLPERKPQLESTSLCPPLCIGKLKLSPIRFDHKFDSIVSGSKERWSMSNPNSPRIFIRKSSNSPGRDLNFAFGASDEFNAASSTLPYSIKPRFNFMPSEKRKEIIAEQEESFVNGWEINGEPPSPSLF